MGKSVSAAHNKIVQAKEMRTPCKTEAWLEIIAFDGHQILRAATASGIAERWNEDRGNDLVAAGQRDWANRKALREIR